MNPQFGKSVARALLAAAACTAMLGMLLPLPVDQYTVWYSIDNGGADFTPSNSGQFELAGTIGQADAGALTSASGAFELLGGFQGGVDTGPITRLYVKWDAFGGANDGLDWGNAFLNLQDALDEADRLETEEGEDIQEIWVARGTYRPDVSAADPNGSGSPGATFALRNGIALYGGFAGMETELGQRLLYDPNSYDPASADDPANATILSGEIGDPNSVSDNSYHVVTANGTNLTARLDGFAIAAGNANGGGSFADIGAGLYNPAGSALIVRCTFVNNAADTAGGAVVTSGNSATTFVNCRFLGNTAGFAGAVHINGSGNQTSFMNCAFTGNDAVAGSGGAVRADVSTVPEFVNCTFHRNTATSGDAGGIHVNGGVVTVTNCIFWENRDAFPAADESAQLYVASGSANVNYSDVQGLVSLGGVGNIGSLTTDDPGFFDPNGPDGVPGTVDDDLHLGYQTPCIDAGDNTAVPVDVADLDLDGDPNELTPVDAGSAPRFGDDPDTVDSGVPYPPNYPNVADMGAYEYRFVDCNGNGVLDTFDIDPNNPMPSPDCDGNGTPDECQLNRPEVAVKWTAGTGLWSDTSKWCPGAGAPTPTFNPDYPANGPDLFYGVDQSFFVTVGDAGFGPPAISLNTSFNLSQLILEPDSRIELTGLSSQSVGFQSLATTSRSRGTIRVRSTSALADLRLDIANLNLDQDPNGTGDPNTSGVLEADGAGTGKKAELVLTECLIRGGQLRAINGGEARLHDTTLNGVIVMDALVENNNTSQVANVIQNPSTIRVWEDPNDPNVVLGQSVMQATAVGATLTGGGRVVLASETWSTLGGALGTLTNAADHTIEGAGQIVGDLTNIGQVSANVSGGQLTIADPNATILNNGTFSATDGGVLVLNAPFNGTGDLLAQGGDIQVDNSGSGSGVGNASDVDVLPGSPSKLIVSGGGTVLNATNDLTVTGGRAKVCGGATFYIGNDATINQDTNLDPNAVAYLIIDDPNNGCDPNSAVTVGNQVTIGDFGALTAGHVVVEGTLTVTGPGVYLEYGTLTGNGTINGDVFVNGGTTGPGSSAGELTIAGNYLQVVGSLAIEVGGIDPNNYDVLTVTGTASMAGTLELSLIGGFTPQFGDEFTVLTASQVTGSFSQITAPALPDQLGWVVDYGGAAVVVSIVDTCPEDLDNDGDVDLGDLAQMLANYPTPSGATLDDGDLDGDGDVDLSDLAALLSVYGTPCP